MRVAVIGSGVVGVTSAYELAADGHEVTVFERRGSVAVEASFAHAGLITPDGLAPWQATGRLFGLLRGWFNPQAAAKLSPRASPATWRWLVRWRRAARRPSQRAHRARMQQLVLYSRDHLRHLTQLLHLDYERADGHLLLLRSDRDLDAPLQDTLSLLQAQEIAVERCEPARCLQLEPGLNTGTPLYGGIHLPGDSVGNCRQFTLLLRGEAEKLGVEFRFHTNALSVRPGTRPEVVSVHSPHEDTLLASMGPESSKSLAFQVTAPMNGPQTETFDAVLVCAATGAPALLKPLGFRLPMVAVQGHSVTMPARQHEAHFHAGPRSVVTDHRHQVVISRLGSRIRVSGGFEVGGSPGGRDPAALARLYQALDDWFPGAARLSEAQRWKGARPVLPDGKPVLGPSGRPGVWLNVGHGASGWAMACGSARLLADAMGGRRPAIDVDGLGAERLQP